MEIKSVKIQTINNEFIGYKVNGNSFFPKENCELIKQWIADGNNPESEFTEEELKTKFENEFRQNRDNLLSTVVDHYQKPLVWETLTVEQQDKVRTYRQALLDSTNNWILLEELVL